MGYRQTDRCGLSTAVLRSLYQKAVRRGEVALAQSAASELIHNGHGKSAITRLLIFIAEDFGLASPGLLEVVTRRIKQILRQVKKVSEIIDKPTVCRQILELVSIVASPDWKRSRALALSTARSIQYVDQKQQPNVDDVYMNKLVHFSKTWIYSSANDLRKLVLKDCPSFKDAWTLTGSNRLIYSYAMAIGCFNVSNSVKSLPYFALTDDRFNELMHVEYKFPPIPEYAIDKHVSNDPTKDMEHFFNVGAVIVNQIQSSLLPKPLLLAAAQGRAYYMYLAKKYDAKQARSAKIKERLLRKSTVQPLASVHVQPKPKTKRKARTLAEVEARQKMLRNHFETKVPEFLVGAEWCQKVTGGNKVPVWKHDNKLWKGPFPPSIDLNLSIKRHQVITQFLPYDMYSLNIHNRFLVMSIAPGSSPFGKGFVVPSCEVFATNLLLACASKLCLHGPCLGDLVPRNLVYHEELKTFYPIDFEDKVHTPHEVDFNNFSRNLFRKGIASAIRKDLAVSLIYLFKRFYTNICITLQSKRSFRHEMWDHSRYEKFFQAFQMNCR